jgi:hypothetical protein
MMLSLWLGIIRGFEDITFRRHVGDHQPLAEQFIPDELKPHNSKSSGSEKMWGVS